jgi:transposase, IS5 family
MYRKDNHHQMKCDDFYLPFGGKLRSDRRRAILPQQIPWQQIKVKYASNFEDSVTGTIAKPARLALGALIIKERLSVTDRETVLQIQENPCLRYFFGFPQHADEPPIDPSLMVHFRKRFDKETLAKINEAIVVKATSSQETKRATATSSDDDKSPPNQGKLIMDATCTPADITYPTDLKLVKKVREKTEEIIDLMHTPFVGERQKSRTNRQKPRQDYLAVAKQKKPSVRLIRKAIRKQLGYVGRNLKTIDKMASEGLLKLLSRRLYRLLLVSQDVYRQQYWMYPNNCHSISARIVSLYQPHARPIARGKAKNPVEFGANISVSLVGGMSLVVDTLSSDAFNKSGDLIMQIKACQERFGCYPKSVHVDKIYRTLDNRRFCKEYGIRRSGTPLARPKQMTETNKKALAQIRCQQRQDERDRNAIEGKFGQGKRRFILNRIMAKLAETSEAVIMVSFIAMKLDRILSDILLFAWNMRLSLWCTPWTMTWLSNNRQPECLSPCKLQAALAF